MITPPRAMATRSRSRRPITLRQSGHRVSNHSQPAWGKPGQGGGVNEKKSPKVVLTQTPQTQVRP